MSLHKLTAGSGYDYLTRQVAAMDSTEKGHTSLASYYTEKGEVPGRWVGAGLTGIDGLEAGDIVTAGQMKSLFAFGFHPLADERLAALEPSASTSQVRLAQRLGVPFKVYEGDVPPFQVEVARRVEEFNVSLGRVRDAEATIDERAQIRSEIARELFQREHGRAPSDDRELAATVAKHTRPRTTAVAGYDLTFSPVKSVSALWALAEPSVAARIERAHDAAIAEALSFIEREALFTRTGPQGVRQVDVRGLVAATFTHRDSRAGDPDLHTHVAVANKVQTRDGGRWLSIDGRIIFKANIAASEVYNTALERNLAADLGLRFAPRPDSDPRKKPIREIVGVDPRLNQRWSQRRLSIEGRQAQLTTKFQADHGRPPTPVEAYQLAQQATLETRGAKHEPRSLDEQRGEWRAQAVEVLGERGADLMVRRALSPTLGPGTRVTAAWMETTGRRIVREVQDRRSTWQVWHLMAEAQRQVRGADLAPQQAQHVVGLLVDQATAQSIRLVTDLDSIVDPPELRRADGSSVYSVSGSALFTSRDVLEAEARIVAAAAQSDGHRLDDNLVSLAVMECAVSGVELNAGQANLVRQMATSGRRIQLGIAAAGTGKTTAMRVLTKAWEESGGNVIGLAPSAAAAAALRDQTGSTTETLAKLVTELAPDVHATIANQIHAGTLVIVDEAGMADTISLDKAIQYALSRGASVRLLGDDQQLAAIGAGGVLRDVEAHQGAVRLSELMRFTDSAEAAATLALRDGRPEALGFYLDNSRVHVGDLSTMTDAVFAAWSLDQQSGRDSIMLAPTRDIVADLNARARTSRLSQSPGGPAPSVVLADGNEASIGDIVITRENSRKLRISATDWVKNGDRWIVTRVLADSIVVAHKESGLKVSLPPEYVATNTELGYASTVHTAQGVTADTMHGIVSGDEARQQLYTMMTRGRLANHAYVASASDGDPQSLIRPESVHPMTAADILIDVLARDGSPKSATTMAREATDPAVQLHESAARYTDAVYVGAETLIGQDRVTKIESQADVLVPGIADEPAWPVLRAHLVLREAHRSDAVAALADAVASRRLDGAADRAALLDWRLDPTGMRGASNGPLPWLPEIPRVLREDPRWGSYLDERGERVVQLAAIVGASSATAGTPDWARQGSARPDPDLLADVSIWRAANGIEPADRRPTGPPVAQKAASLHQRSLDSRLCSGREPALDEWGPILDQIHPRRDAFTPLLAERLAAVSRTGIDAAALLRRAAAEDALPDEHIAAALWWRIARHLSPAVTIDAGSGTAIEADWEFHLLDLLGPVGAHDVTTSASWPTLVSLVDAAVERGWRVNELLDFATTSVSEDVDPAQAMIWRIAIVTNPPPDGDEPDLNPAPADLHDDAPPPQDEECSVEAALAEAVRQRSLLGPLEPSDAEIGTQLDRAWEMKTSAVPPQRVLEVLEATSTFYESQFEGSWAHEHLLLRFGQDIAGDDRFRPGFAPAGWTLLIDHLRAQGVRDDELIAAGVAKTASTGRLIDRFRDRAILPVIHEGYVIGFVGRRNPEVSDENAGPKYLNSPDTIVFHKGAQLFGIADERMSNGSIPVIVEGPVDAIAVTLATGGAFVGVAPLGTALTEEQATQLARLGADPIVATDGDLAGRIAAERDFWILTPHLLEPKFVRFGEDDDPASILERLGPIPLVSALQAATPLADEMVEERLSNSVDAGLSAKDLSAVIAAQRPESWGAQIERVSESLPLASSELRRAIAASAAEFNSGRRRFSERGMAQVGDTRRRMEDAESAVPATRWAPLGRSIDPRLTADSDWAGTADLLHELHEKGIDVAAALRASTFVEPLSATPGKDLQLRLTQRFGLAGAVPAPPRPNQPSQTRANGRTTHEYGPERDADTNRGPKR